MKHDTAIVASIETKGANDGADGFPRASDEFTSTITIFGVEICTAKGDTPGDAERKVKEKFAKAISKAVWEHNDA
jgi:hypothetical protein